MELCPIMPGSAGFVWRLISLEDQDIRRHLRERGADPDPDGPDCHADFEISETQKQLQMDSVQIYSRSGKSRKTLTTFRRKNEDLTSLV
jgi:hypothetical protein